MVENAVPAVTLNQETRTAVYREWSSPYVLAMQNNNIQRRIKDARYLFLFQLSAPPPALFIFIHAEIAAATAPCKH